MRFKNMAWIIIKMFVHGGEINERNKYCLVVQNRFDEP